MKKISIVGVLFVVVLTVTMAQEEDLGEIASSRRVFDTGNQVLKEISIDKFEDSGVWHATMPIDLGVVHSRRIYGSPSLKEPIDAIDSLPYYDPVDNYVIGVRANFFHRGTGRISLATRKPIFVPGVVKELSLWIVGRNKKHSIRAIIEDVDGNRKSLPMGNLRFRGWRKLSVIVPSSINQEDISGTYGLYLIGFVIDVDFEDTRGDYYVYFDDVRAKSDLIAEYLYYEDDMSDGW